MTYAGEQCPVCKKEFTGDDDVVVCPECGTPHHRSCYAEKNRCENAEKHPTGFFWEPKRAPQLAGDASPKQPQADEQSNGHRVIFCPNCGRENPAEEPVCTGCGARLYNNQNGGKPFVPPVELPNMYNRPFAGGTVPIAPTDRLGENTVGDCAEFIGVNAHKYIPKMYKAEREGKKISWNWAAFIFAPYWFFYRKMQIAGAVCMLILLAATALFTNTNVVQASNALAEKTGGFYAGAVTQQELMTEYQRYITLPENAAVLGINFAIHLYAGLFGNMHYKKKVNKEVSVLRTSAQNTEQYRLSLFRKGGVSGVMFALSYIGFNSALQLVALVVQKYILKM